MFVSIHIPVTLFAQKEFYTPKSLIIPLHDQNNQLHLSVGRGGGYDFNVSYAFTDNLALFSAATLDNGTKRRTTLLSNYKIEKNDYVLKGGFGYFRKVSSPIFSILEAYAGAGFSKIDNYWYFVGNDNGDFTKAKYWSAFTQFNAGHKTQKFNYAIALRLNYSKYTDFSFYSDHPNTRTEINSYENLKGLTTDFVCSFGYTLKGFALNAQAGLALPISSPAVITTRTYQVSGTKVTSTENPELVAALGRLSLQYNLDFNKPK